MSEQKLKVSPTPPSKHIENPDSLDSQKTENSSFVMIPLSLLQIWNEHHGSLSSVREFTKERREKCRVRIQSHAGKLEAFSTDFREAVKKAAAQQWKNWRPNFDWFVRNDTNYVAILEGKYDWLQNAGPQDSARDRREARKRANESAAKRIAARFGEDIGGAGETGRPLRPGNQR